MRWDISKIKEFAQQNQSECLSHAYLGQRIKLEWKCKHGHNWQETLERMIQLSKQNKWCLQCAKQNSKSDKLYKIKDYALGHKIICLSDKYDDANQKLEWICRICSHEFATRWSHFKNNQTKCPRCAGKAKRTLDDARKIAFQKHGKCLSNEYKDCMLPLLWECSKGHQWEARLDSVLNSNTWCRQCVFDDLFRNPEWRPKISKAQLKIHEAIGGKLNYPIEGFFVDIAFDDKKLCIEYDGSGHNMAVKLGRFSLKQFHRYEKWRQSKICNSGWNIIRLVSKKDSVPINIDSIIKSSESLFNENRKIVIIDLDSL